MGNGTNRFYSVVFRGDDGLVSPPTIEHMLGYFDIGLRDRASISSTALAKTVERPSRTDRAVLERRRLHSHTPPVAVHE